VTPSRERAIVLTEWRRRARQLKLEIYALYLAQRDPRTPWYAKVLTAIVVAYAFSPLDLIPDFVPILGYLDDLVLVPLGITLALKAVPAAVMTECRQRAQERLSSDWPGGRIAGAVIVLLWIMSISWVLWRVWRLWTGRSA
jgi:uncharacterized membrane protein YkvA (DUF1232 family)